MRWSERISSHPHLKLSIKLDSHLQLFNLQPSTITMYTGTFSTQISTPWHNMTKFWNPRKKLQKTATCVTQWAINYKCHNKNREYKILILNLLSCFSFIFTQKKNDVNHGNKKLPSDTSWARNFGTVTIWAMHLGGTGLSTHTHTQWLYSLPTKSH